MHYEKNIYHTDRIVASPRTGSSPEICLCGYGIYFEQYSQLIKLPRNNWIKYPRTGRRKWRPNMLKLKRCIRIIRQKGYCWRKICGRQREECHRQQGKRSKRTSEKLFRTGWCLFKKRQELIQPIQDEIYKAIKDLATENGYAVIFDTSSGPSMIYTNPTV